MAKQIIKEKHSELLECNGLDKNYKVIHLLNSKEIIVQLVEEENWHTFSEDKYTCTRDSENTVNIKFNAPPIARKKFYVLAIRVN